MEDTLKKLLYAGVGLAAQATEKFENAIDDLVSKGKISDNEGKKIVDDFFKKSDKKKDEFEGKFKKATEEIVSRFNYVRKKDFDSVVKKIEKLEKEMKKGSTNRKSTVKRAASSVKRTASTAAKKAAATVKS